MTRTIEEIQKEIDQNADDRRVLERVKNECTARIAELVRQKAEIEAEKPKLRHGDFGITNSGHYRAFLSEFVKGYDWGKPTGDHKEYSEIGVMADEDFTVFGNIFDLMEGWGEDLEEFNVGGRHFKINPGDPESFLQIEEIWHKLGALIMTHKRKQS
jgi:hypothetical protein